MRLVLFLWIFGNVCYAQASDLVKINPKKVCLFTAWHAGLGISNNLYVNVEKSLAIRKIRKVNAFNKSEFTYLSLGLIGHLNKNPTKFIFGPTAQLQAGFAKYKHFWPTARYTYLVNETTNPHRFAIGMSYLPLKNCGIHYEFSFPNKPGQNIYLRHQFGIAVNIKTKKIWCEEVKKVEKKN
jgi:hypothetical protein